MTSSIETPAIPERPAYSRMLGLFSGIVVPCVAFGNAGLAIAFGIASIMAVCALQSEEIRRRIRRLLKGPVVVLGCATLGWWVLSAGFSIDPVKSFKVIARILVYLCLFLCLTVVLSRRPIARQVAESAFILAFASVNSMIVLALLVEPVLLSVFKPFSSAPLNALTMFKAYQSAIAISIPVLVWLGWQRRGGWRLLVLIAVGTGLSLIAGITGVSAHSAFAGLVGAVLMALLLLIAARLGHRARIGIFVVLMTMAVVGGVTIISQLPEPPVTEATREAPPLPIIDFHRQAIWGFVYHQALEAPILGHGINTINLVPGAELEVLDINQEYVPGHAHNWVLEILSETGFPGLFLFAATQVLVLLSLARHALMGNSGAFAACAVFGAYWTSSLANFSIWSSWWQVAVLCVLALPLSQVFGPGNRNSHQP